MNKNEYMKPNMKSFGTEICPICGRKLDAGEKAHHIFPRGSFPSLVNDPNNLIFLCYNCHVKVHLLRREEITERIFNWCTNNRPGWDEWASKVGSKLYTTWLNKIECYPD